MLWMYGWSQQVYVQVFKRQKVAWAVTQNQLRVYPNGSLGLELYNFLQANDFDLMEKLERHDVYHIITETGTEIENEIAMQYLLCGNGKKSLYMASMIAIGSVVFPEYVPLYCKKFKEGKKLKQLDKIEFEHLLNEDLQLIKQTIKK